VKIERPFRFKHQSGSFESHAVLSIEFSASRVPNPPQEEVEKALDEALEELVDDGYAIVEDA
jgi:hypothetical protein